MNGTRGLVIAIAASFIVGCSAGLMGGILFTHLMGAHRWGHERSPFGRHEGPPGRGGPRGPAREMLPYLSRELDLSAEQQQHIQVLIDRARQEHQAVRESMEVWVGRELTPEQRMRWKDLERQMGMRRRGPDRGGPPPERP